MTIEKLKSGSYRVKQMVNGVTYRVTVDKKPSEKEAHLLIADAMAKKGTVTTTNIPFKSAYLAYVESKSNVLSPSTVSSGYNSIIRQVSEDFKNTPIGSITKPMVQAEVNRYSANHSPKSTDNFSGLILSVLRYYGNDITGIRKPQKKKTEVYIPTEEEVHAIYEAVKNTKYYVPLLLAGNGLRRSEICALTMDDLDGCVLTINKALVQNENKEWVIKTTKTESSTRKINLDKKIVEIINERGFYTGHPELIYRKLVETQKKLGIKHFKLHAMRHFYASYLYSIGVPPKNIQQEGGWKTNKIMETVYTHAMEQEKQKSVIASALGKLV